MFLFPFIALLVSLGNPAPAWAADAKAGAVSAAKAISVTGRVLVRKDDQKETQNRALKVGEDVYPNDVINTASNSALKLLFTDKTILDLGPSALLKVNDYKLKDGASREVALSLDYGKIRAAVNTPVGPKGKFLIRTKTTTMGVRGTEFIVASDFSAGASGKTGDQSVKTEITVVHGKVEVTDKAAVKGAAPIAITAGKQLVTTSAMSGDKVLARTGAGAGEAPKVVELSKAQMSTVVSEARVEDKTFKQAVVVDTSSNSGGGGPTNNTAGSSAGNTTIAAIHEVVQADTAPAAAPPAAVSAHNVPGSFDGGTTNGLPRHIDQSSRPVRLTVNLTY